MARKPRNTQRQTTPAPAEQQQAPVQQQTPQTQAPQQQPGGTLRVETLSRLKYRGTYIPAGTTVDFPVGLAKSLHKSGAVRVLTGKK